MWRLLLCFCHVFVAILCLPMVAVIAKGYGVICFSPLSTNPSNFSPSLSPCLWVSQHIFYVPRSSVWPLSRSAWTLYWRGLQREFGETQVVLQMALLYLLHRAIPVPSEMPQLWVYLSPNAEKMERSFWWENPWTWTTKPQAHRRGVEMM